MAIVVTGAYGFIGSNIVQALNQRGLTDIIAVDNLTQGDKFLNLIHGEIAHFMDKRDFMAKLQVGEFDGTIQAVLHQGACSDTMNHDGRYMMENNYQYTLNLLDFCQRNHIPFIYASSAATYGKGTVFKEARDCEGPLNCYGYSKFLMDQIVRQRMVSGLEAQVVGLRYFNVYGPHEQHKGRMASVAFHHFHQYLNEGKVKLFSGWDGWGNGMQSRDFISIDDVVKVNLYFLDHPEKSGIFNLGTGRSQPFNDVACAVINACRRHEGLDFLPLEVLQAQGQIEYIPFPDTLKGKYQSFTQANIDYLRQEGYTDAFLTVEEGVSQYVDWLLT